jgi:hypothetical protein
MIFPLDSQDGRSQILSFSMPYGLSSAKFWDDDHCFYVIPDVRFLQALPGKKSYDLESRVRGCVVGNRVY